MKIYGDEKSGNCYKLQLVCALLDIDYEWIAIDILKGQTQTPEFLAKNPKGKIPLLILDNGSVLTESNAILNYLANDSELIPKDKFLLAKVQQWQFFEQYSHEPYVAVARFITKYLGMPENKISAHKEKLIGGYKALDIMEEQLTKTSYLTGDKLTVADISLFAYTYVAEEGGFDLQKYIHINKWIHRIEEQENFISIAK